MRLINEISKKEFILIFKNIFEKCDWIAEELYNFKPFNDFNELENKIYEIFNRLNDKKKLEIIINHPDLADKAKIRTLTLDSFNEQSNSELDQCSENEFNQFQNLNKTYKKKFGFPFIFAISGKKKKEILTNFKKRIYSQRNNEFKEAIKQVKKIAKFRLNKIKVNMKL